MAAADKVKVNTRVVSVADGSKQLVFTAQGTGECVGEMRVAAEHGYLPVMAQLFSQYVKWNPVTAAPSEISQALRRAINGHG